MTRGQSGTVLVGTVLVAVLGAADIASAKRADEVREQVKRLNREWAGAECVIRLPLEIRKKANREGWYRGYWTVKVAGPDEESGFYYQLRISDRDRVTRFLDGKVMRPGTRFIADGWGFEEPEKAAGLYLDLHFADAPARARWIFTTKSMSTDSKVNLAELRYIESYMRIQAHKVRFSSEKLVEIAAPPPTPAASPTFPPPPTPVTREVFSPDVRILAVAVEPPQLRQGERARLVLSYEVAGLPPGTSFEVVEERRLMAGERQLTSFSDRVARSVGSFTSELPVDIPGTVAPGLYTLEGSVSVAGASATGHAIFQVMAAAPGPVP